MFEKKITSMDRKTQNGQKHRHLMEDEAQIGHTYIKTCSNNQLQGKYKLKPQ